MFNAIEYTHITVYFCFRLQILLKNKSKKTVEFSHISEVKGITNITFIPRFSGFHYAKTTKKSLYNCTNVQMYNCTNVQMYKCTTVQLYNCTTIQLYKCITVQMYNCTTVQL